MAWVGPKLTRREYPSRPELVAFSIQPPCCPLAVTQKGRSRSTCASVTPLEHM